MSRHEILPVLGLDKSISTLYKREIQCADILLLAGNSSCTHAADDRVEIEPDVAFDGELVKRHWIKRRYRER
jgi:hypothetical protein